MKENTPQPPKWADRFLSWYCNPKLLEQIQGDVHELFYWRLEEVGYGKAKRSFTWDVMRLFRWSNIKRTTSQTQKTNNIAMFKNYFKIGLRNLWKQRMPSTINIIGLSLAIGCCIVAYMYIDSQVIRDDYHEKSDRTFLATHDAFVDGGIQRYGYLSLAITDLIAEDFSGVNNVVRYGSGSISVKIGNKGFAEFAAFTDKGFFDTFSFKIIHGDNKALNKPNQVALASETSKRYFGEEYPIGKVISIKFGEERHDFEVAVVYEEPPRNSSLRPEVLLNYFWLKKNREVKTTNTHVFIELNKGANPEEVIAGFQTLVNVQNGFNLERKYESIGLEPIKTMAKNSREIQGGIGRTSPMAPMILLACIGSFMLILATFNYINIATVMATRRIKEIGVRKVIGGKRGQLVTQFLTENLILCTFSVVLGCLLAAGFFMPQFNEISGSSIRLNIFEHKSLWIFLLGLLLFISFASGAYPALFVSKFKPVKIFRGNQNIGGKRRFTSVLLTFQLILATVTILGGVMAVRANNSNESREWGYDQFNKIVVGVSPTYYQAFRQNTLKNPNVEAVAGSVNSMSRTWDFRLMKVGELELTGQVLTADRSYPEFLEIPLISGRYFDESLVSDLTSSVLVNQTFIDRFGLDGSKDHQVMIDSVNYQVVGVLQDYYYSSFQDGVEPAVFKVAPDSLMTSLTVLVKEGTISEVRDELESVWENLGTETPFNSHIQSETRDREYEDARGLRNVLLFTASLAVILSAMGLFGLVSLNISARIKDFGIKKILGAGTLHITKEVYKKFSFILGFAIVLGSLAGTKVVSLLLDNVYGEHTSIGVLPLLLSALLLLSVAAITINTQMRRIKNLNPAETLRVE